MKNPPNFTGPLHRSDLVEFLYHSCMEASSDAPTNPASPPIIEMFNFRF